MSFVRTGGTHAERLAPTSVRRRPDTLRARFPATWRSGYAAACKAVYTGSIPVVASVEKARDCGPFLCPNEVVAKSMCPGCVPEVSARRARSRQKRRERGTSVALAPQSTTSGDWSCCPFPHRGVTAPTRANSQSGRALRLVPLDHAAAVWADGPMSPASKPSRRDPRAPVTRARPSPALAASRSSTTAVSVRRRSARAQPHRHPVPAQ